MRRYFVSAMPLHGPRDWLADYVEAETFEEAEQLAHAGAIARFHGRPYRLTSVAEQPELEDSGPIALALDLTGGRS